MRIGAEASAVVGETPLVLLERMADGLGGQVCVKLEYFNPGGSVKDRIGVAMIDAAEEEGKLRPGRSVVVEPTSGNTGIALAMVCAARGYELILTLPEGMSRERAKLLRAYGAEVRETPSLGGMNEAVALAEEIREQRQGLHADAVLQPRQRRRPPPHHRGGDLARHRRPDRRLRRRRRDRRHDHRRRPDAEANGRRRRWSSRSSRPARRSSPAAPRARTRSRGSAPASSPRCSTARSIDEVLAVSDEDALETARLIAREEGILAGISAGANIWAALQVAARPQMAGKRVVTVVCDSGERYMSLPFFSP